MRTFAYAGAAVFYLAASLQYLRSFVRARPGSSRAVSALIFAGVLLHATGVALYWLHFREPPLVGLGPSLVSLSLLVALALLGLEMYSSAGAIALLLSPVALLLLLFAMLARVEPAGSATAFRGPWLALHASLGFVGYASWMVAAASGLMYLLQFRELKDKRLGAVFRFFPALEILDRLGRRSLITGFFALTLGIILGVAWVLRFDPEVLRGEPKVIWGLGSWAVMLVVLWLRLGGRRTGREAAFWSVAGFALVFLTYLVAKLMAPETRFFL